MTYQELLSKLHETERYTEVMEAVVQTRIDALDADFVNDPVIVEDTKMETALWWIQDSVHTAEEAVAAYGEATDEAQDAHQNAVDTVASYGLIDDFDGPVAQFIYANTCHIDE